MAWGALAAAQAVNAELTRQLAALTAEILPLRKLLAAVRLMRQHQRAWFRDHNPSDLADSKRIEREVDRIIGEIDNPAAPGLFGKQQ